MMQVLLVVLLFLSILTRVMPFAVYLVQKDCATLIEEGVVMMGKEVEFSSDRTIVAKLNGETLINGSVINSLEAVEFEIDPKSSQSVLEVRTNGVEFISGKCNGRRVLKKGSLVITSSGIFQNSGLIEIKVFGAWATSMTTGVKKTADFTLYLSQERERRKDTAEL